MKSMDQMKGKKNQLWLTRLLVVLGVISGWISHHFEIFDTSIFVEAYENESDEKQERKNESNNQACFHSIAVG